MLVVNRETQLLTFSLSEFFELFEVFATDGDGGVVVFLFGSFHGFFRSRTPLCVRIYAGAAPLWFVVFSFHYRFFFFLAIGLVRPLLCLLITRFSPRPLLWVLWPVAHVRRVSSSSNELLRGVFDPLAMCLVQFVFFS